MTSASSSPVSKDSIVCKINLPDERSPPEIAMKKATTGLDLLEKVFDELGIVEKDYFGLSFKDHSGCLRWLESHKTLAHQFSKLRAPICLNLQIKFYPNDPVHLKNDFSRYLLFRQIRQDIFENRLYVPDGSIPRLLGLLLQSEFLDWSPELPEDYPSQVKFKPESLNPSLLEQAVAIHKSLNGLTVKDVEVQFVQEVTNYPSYGLDMYHCKDQEDASLVVGIGCNGISTFAFGKLTHSFKWREITKMYHEGKQFFATIRLHEHKHLCAFRCQSTTQAKVMWKSAMERKTFFTAVSSNENNRAEKRSALSLVLKRSTTFNFHGRVQREVIKDDIERESPFMRYSWASNTLPRMGKAALQPPQNPDLLMTPSPSPSAHDSATTLGASPGSETTIVDKTAAPVVEAVQIEPDERPPGALIPPPTTNANNNAESLFNTPPASPDLVNTTTTEQVSRLAEDSGNMSGSDIETNNATAISVASLHSQFEGTEAIGETASHEAAQTISEEQLKTYSTHDDDSEEDLVGLTKTTNSDGDKNIENENSPAVSTAPPVPSVKFSPRALVLQILVAFVLLLLFMVVLFEVPLAQLKQLPFYDSLRHTYYEPLREVVVPRLQNAFKGR